MIIDLPAGLEQLLLSLSGKPVSEIFRSVMDTGREQKLPLLAVTSFALIFATSTILKFFRSLKKVNFVAGYRRPFFPYGLVGMILPTAYWNPGYYFLWRWRYDNYKRFKSEVFSYVSWFSGKSVIYTNNLDIMRQVAGGTRSGFHKPLSASQGLLQWGMNLIAAEGGEEWRKHRRIMGPAFTNDMYRMVWSETAKVYGEMCTAEGWKDQSVVEVDSVQKHAYKLALLVLGTCVFGFNFSWKEPPVSADGTMSLQRALQVFNDRQITLMLPKWITSMPFKFFKEHHQAKETLTEWMTSQVGHRREILHQGALDDDAKLDCFSLLVKANEDEGQKFRLTDGELIGNVFVLLLAGHETSANSLAATLALLAIHPEIQDEIIEHIVSVVGWDREPVSAFLNASRQNLTSLVAQKEFEDYSSLNKVLALFYEALRLFPAAHIMFREALSDTVLQVPNPPGRDGNTPLALPKGAMIIVDMVGVQYNERYFEEPEKFKPSRWYNIPNDDAVSAFSLGPRACIGRKFATVEAVSLLTLFLRDWKIEPLLNPGESEDQWKTRIIDAELFVTLGIRSVPLRFVRRERK